MLGYLLKQMEVQRYAKFHNYWYERQLEDAKRGIPTIWTRCGHNSILRYRALLNMLLPCAAQYAAAVRRAPHNMLLPCAAQHAAAVRRAPHNMLLPCTAQYAAAARCTVCCSRTLHNAAPVRCTTLLPYAAQQDTAAVRRTTCCCCGNCCVVLHNSRDLGWSLCMWMHLRPSVWSMQIRITLRKHGASDQEPN